MDSEFIMLKNKANICLDTPCALRRVRKIPQHVILVVQLGENTKTTFFIQNNFRMYLTYHWGLRPVLFTIDGARIGR